MSSALQVEKTGRQRGVIVNESEERAKARIEVSKAEEGLFYLLLTCNLLSVFITLTGRVKNT
jgi:hypothetical protein